MDYPLNISAFVLPYRSILYRVQPTIEKMSDVEPQRCMDTKKLGVYFSNSLTISLAMIIEHNTPLDLGIFITRSPLILSNGKFEFRKLNINKYFIDNIPIKNPLPNPVPGENLSHIEFGLYPLDSNSEILLTGTPLQRFENMPARDEIFLNGRDLHSVQLVSAYHLAAPIPELKYMIASNPQQSIFDYIDQGIFIKKPQIIPETYNFAYNF